MKHCVTTCLIMLSGQLSVGCSADSKMDPPGVWHGTVEVRDGQTVIRNPAEPVLGRLTLELEEDLVIGDTLHEESFFFHLITARVDGDGNIFIWDPDSYRIQVFDRDGRFLRTVGTQGHGPGEFSDGFGLRFHVGMDGRLAVLDGGRIQFFGPAGAYERRVMAPPMSSRFAVLAGGRLLHDRVSDSGDGLVEEVVLAGKTGEPAQTLAGYPSEKWRGAFIDRLRFTHLAPEVVLAPTGNGGAVFGYPTAYRVAVVDGDGQAARVIEMAEAPREMDADLEAALIADMSSDEPGRSPRDLHGEVYIPETWPFFDAIFSDERGNVLVQRSVPLPEPGAARRLDLFTAQGMYLYDLRVPADDIQAVRNGFLYARRFDRDSNVGQLVRYRMLGWDAVVDAAAQADRNAVVGSVRDARRAGR